MYFLFYISRKFRENETFEGIDLQHLISDDGHENNPILQSFSEPMMHYTS